MLRRLLLLFLPKKIHSQEKLSSPDLLQDVLEGMTKEYFNTPIPPYYFRHLRATAFLKKYPGNFLYVAELLNDSLDTVIKHYCKHNENRIGDKDDEDFNEKYVMSR